MIFLQTPLSILLQVPTLTPEQIEQRRDSVRQGAQQMIEYAKTDPHGFWQTVGETMLQFGMKVLAALLRYVADQSAQTRTETYVRAT